MADNTVLNAGTGGDTVAADDIGGTKYQRLKLVHGVDGTNDGDVARTNPLPVAPSGQVSGGDAVYHVVATGTLADKANVKASAGQIYGVHVFNAAAYPVYVKFHNTASVPTPGAGVVLTVGVQAGLARDVLFPNGFALGTGIGITLTKLLADADATTLVAGDCVVDVDYK